MKVVPAQPPRNTSDIFQFGRQPQGNGGCHQIKMQMGSLSEPITHPATGWLETCSANYDERYAHAEARRMVAVLRPSLQGGQLEQDGASSMDC